MRKVFLFTALMIVSNVIFAQKWEWVKSIAGKGADCGYSVAVDNNNNVIIAGSFKDNLIIDKREIHCMGFYDIIIAKFSAEGNLLWYRQAGGNDLDEAYGVTCDPKGNVYVTGYFSDLGDFGGMTIKSAGDKDFFLAKYSPEGNLLWIKKSDGQKEEYGVSVVADKDGYSYVTGAFTGVGQFDNAFITSQGERDIFIAKYSPEGNVVWVKQGGGKTADEPTAIALDKDNNCYVTGWFTGSAKFDNETLNSYGKDDIFIVKYNPKGQLAWVAQGGSAESNDHSCGIAVDNTGNCYITGYFSGTAKFGNKEIKSSGGDDIFIVKYDNKKDVVWAKQTGGKDGEYGRAIALDSQNNIIVTGEFNVSFTAGPNKFKSLGDWDIFIMKLNASGDIIAGTQAGGTGYDRPYGIAIDKSDNYLLTGKFNQAATFGTINVANAGDFDIFIAKMNGFTGKK